MPIRKSATPKNDKKNYYYCKQAPRTPTIRRFRYDMIREINPVKISTPQEKQTVY